MCLLIQKITNQPMPLEKNEQVRTEKNEVQQLTLWISGGCQKVSC
jgi:hypothetical protein